MKCQNCGNEYQKIATHWARSDCSYPSFSSHQIELLTGILMGDGTIDDRFDKNRNPRFKLQITNLKYAQYVYEKLGNLSTREPYIHRTAEQLANTESEFTNSSNPDDYKDQYKVQTISHPELTRLEEWYSSGSKIFPNNLELTPTILKHWYVCDGSYNDNGHRNYLEIHLSNERKNKDKINSYFEDIDHPVSRWRDDKQTSGHYKTSVIFNKKETADLFDYMGSPLPGFNYKWP